MAVVGGGISGLAAAHRLVELRPDLRVTVFEASDRLGGVLQTERVDGYLIEHSADNFIINLPWGLDLCDRLGLADQLLPTASTDRRASVVHRGKLVPIPEGFTLMAPGRLWPLVRTPLLSFGGKLRLACEYLIPPRRAETDESLASFARRRLGREAFERLVQPLVAGIYTADPERLSMRAALPRFAAMEDQYGSLVRGTRSEARRQRRAGASDESGARYGLFTAPRDGMGSLIQALAERLPPDSIRLGTTIQRVIPSASGGWQLELGDRTAQAGTSTHDADALIVAAPAPAAASLLESADAALAEQLGQIAYAGCALVIVAYERGQFARPPEGFGFVVPDCERRRILACSYASQKYSGRAPDGQILLRVFIGGGARLAWQEASDAELQRVAREELGELLGVRGEPVLQRVQRWKGAMPQYHVGHLTLLEEIGRLLQRWPTLALAGNAYRGVGVPQCIHSGEQAAERILAALDGR